MIRNLFGKILGLTALVVLAPSVTYGATFKEIVDNQILGLGNQLIRLLYGLAFALFLFGVFRYFFSSGANAEENRQKGKHAMLWGVISLAVLFGIWGILHLFLSILESWA